MVLGALFLVGVLLVVPGAAQDLPEIPGQTEPDVNLSAQSQSQVIEEGECANFQVTVTNSGESVDELPVSFIPAEEVSFSLSSAPARWRTDDAPATVELERGESTTVSVRLCAAEDATKGEPARVTLTATLTPASPADEEQDDTVALSAVVEEDEFFGIPWDFPPWILWVVLAALGVTLAAILISRKPASAGVELECGESSKEVAPGRGTSFPVKIRNEGRSKDLVSLTTSPVPQGWDTFLPIVDVPLEAGDEQTIWISVKSPEDARDGDHVAVKVFARSSSAVGEQASLDLLVTVREPPSFEGAGGESPRSVYEPEDGTRSPARASAVKRRKA